MKRLTFEGNFCDIAMCDEVRGGSFCEDGDCSQRKIWERLKAIENILGDEYDLDRLRELAQADREGRCVVIDVKIGQRVWILDVGEYGDDEIAQPLGLEVYGIALSDDHETYYFVKPPLGMDIDPFSHEDIGKTVFLSREEAEKALEGMKDG